MEAYSVDFLFFSDFLLDILLVGKYLEYYVIYVAYSHIFKDNE